ncbi:MAG: response regulator transcription factor [Candidatus Dormibacteraeota bacterium]|nr:response regulator transcription factor [Candidatus Dormibacteraeota bacterium]
MAEPLHVVLAEDNYLVREGTRRLLEETGAVSVLAAVGTAAELLDAVERLRPAAVMTDIRMPPGHSTEGIAAAHAIRSRHPAVGVVVLSQHAEEHYALALFSAGAAGLAYLLKDRIAEPEDLVSALREVVAGRSVVDPEIVEALVAARTRSAASPVADLTQRELEVLREMASGKTNAAIGRAISLSESAVEKYSSSVFSKLGLTEERETHRRVAAVLAYLDSKRRWEGPAS